MIQHRCKLTRTIRSQAAKEVKRDNLFSTIVQLLKTLWTKLCMNPQENRLWRIS